MNLRRLFTGVCVSLGFLAFAPPALGLANRVFVSARSGNNANDCSNINTPCQTLAGAVVQLNPSGEAIVLDSGGYGPVTITQAVTIEAPPGVVAFIHPPTGNAITVNAGASDVVILRGLVLNGGDSNGIKINTASGVIIESCVISGFAGQGIVNFAPNGALSVKDTISRLNNRGIDVESGGALIEHCRIEGNAASGIFVDGGYATVRDTVSAFNQLDGFRAWSSGTENTFLNVYECVSTHNQQNGVGAFNLGTGSVTVRVGNSSAVVNVGHGFSNSSGLFESLGNNLVRGNVGGDVTAGITVVGGQ